MTTKRTPIISIIVTVIVIASLAVTAIFIYKYRILQYSAEKIVRQYLPDYITVEKMSFDFKSSRVAFSGFKMLNPPNYSRKYLVEIEEVECRYKLKGLNIMSGIEILSPVFNKPFLTIERLPDGRTNLQEVTGFMQSRGAPANAQKTAVASKPSGKAPAGNNYYDIVKIPEEFIVKNGRVVFLDGMVTPGPYTVTLDEIDATLGLKLDQTYTKALSITTAGTGIVNGRRGETIKWDTKLDPTAAALTMSNKFDVSNVDIMAFLPYYDKYSPFVIRSGYFSGMLIFDFNNANIGSTNEVRLSKLSFTVKRGYENAPFLDTTIPDLVKYFTSASGDVIFDFKIKGTMADPQFFLGPIAKQAIASMFIDKIAQALAEDTREQANPQSAAQATGKKSDIEKAAEYIKVFQGILKDNK